MIIAKPKVKARGTEPRTSGMAVTGVKIHIINTSN